MSRKRGVLGVALMAIVAMSVALAPAASGDQLKSDTPQTITLEGQQGLVNLLKTTAGSQECAEVKYVGTVTTPASSATVTPIYGGCLCLGVECTFDMNTCSYKLILESGTSTTAKADIQCTKAGDEITLTSSKCVLHIPPQSALSKIELSNIGSGTTREVKLDFELSGIKYSHTAGTGTGKCSTGSGLAGTFSGSANVTAKNGGGHVGIFVA
jgi:hypothetical protein